MNATFLRAPAPTRPPAPRDAESVLRVVVADDEPMALQRIVRLLGEMPDVAVVAACGSGREALAAARAHRPDVVLLDIEMPGVDGLAVAKRLTGEGGVEGDAPAVVFVTAYDAHAVAAFRVRATDYVLKPLDRTRLRAAVEHARRAVQLTRGARRARGPAAGAGAAHAAAPADARFAVRDGHKEYFVAVADIVYVESFGNYARVHTVGQRLIHRATMARLSEQLAPYRFVRIHRAVIANTARLVRLRPTRNGQCEVLLDTGDRLRVSRTYRAGLEAALHPGLPGPV